MNVAPFRQWRQSHCTAFGKPSIIDDETRIVMRLEQAHAYRGISVAELVRRIGIDRE